jgi:hypothetical protein
VLTALQEQVAQIVAHELMPGKVVGNASHEQIVVAPPQIDRDGARAARPTQPAQTRSSTVPPPGTAAIIAPPVVVTAWRQTSRTP